MKGLELVEDSKGRRGRKGESFIRDKSKEEILESCSPELREKLNKNIEKIKEIEKTHRDTISKIDQNYKNKKEAIELRANRLAESKKLRGKKNAKIASIAIGSAALGIGSAYLAKKHYDKKKSKKNA